MSDVARILKEARDQGRLTALDFAQGIFDDFIELHGEEPYDSPLDEVAQSYG